MQRIWWLLRSKGDGNATLYRPRRAGTDDQGSPAYATDFPAMLEISNWATCNTTANFRFEAETLEHWVQLSQGKPETYQWFVAERDGHVVGFRHGVSVQGSLRVRAHAEVSVYIHPDHVGTGIGSTLYQKLIPYAGRSGLQSLVA